MSFKMLQDNNEIAVFAALLCEHGVRKYLEIGSKFGGSLWAVGSQLPKGSTVTAVDLPRGTKAWKESEKSLNECVGALRKSGRNASIIWGDSTAPDVINDVINLGPYDAVFIDANHTRPYIEKDWSHYSGISRIVAFHDIAWRRDRHWVGNRIDVPQFWNIVKQNYPHVEIKFDKNAKDNGIGVLWRA